MRHAQVYSAGFTSVPPLDVDAYPDAHLDYSHPRIRAGSGVAAVRLRTEDYHAAG
jgi:hypothetical protein